MPSSRAFAVARTIAVVALLGLTGGALGGLLAAGVVAGLVLVSDVGGYFSFGALAAISILSAAFGAAYGVVLGPLLGWTLMRRVPLGRAIGETALLAAFGVEIVIVAAPQMPLGIYGLPALLAGAGALRLRHVYREKAASASQAPSVG